VGLIKHNNIKDIGIIKLDRRKKIEKSETYEEIQEETFENNPEIRVEIDPRKSEEISSEIIDEARKKAEQTKAEANKQSDEIKKAAKKEGYEAGFEEARKETYDSVSKNVHDSLEMINQTIDLRKKVIKESEGEILHLAIKVAEQILKSEISLNRDICLNIVSDAISRVSDRDSITVKVSKDDLESIKRFRDRIASIVDGVKSFSIIEDSSVDPGGCIIETNLGFIDARISTKLKTIEEAFEKAYETELN